MADGDRPGDEESPEDERRIDGRSSDRQATRGITRRDVLLAAATAGASGIAGCFGGDDSTGTGAPTGSSTTSDTPTGGSTSGVTPSGAATGTYTPTDGSTGTASPADDFEEPPNIVQIVVDDLGWSDIGAYRELVPEAEHAPGFGFYETPNVDDRIAGEGTVFTDGYAASPICSPTRASLYTGQDVPRHGITEWLGAGVTKGALVSPKPTPAIPPETPTQARLLSDAGYRTFHLGKWHVTNEQPGIRPGDVGFDVNVAGGHWGSPWNLGENMYFCSGDSFGDAPNLSCSGDDYLTRRLTDEAVSLVDSAPGDAPFFMNLAFYAVHSPFQAPDETVARFRNKREEMGLPTGGVMEDGQRVVQSDATYAAMLAEMDRGVGRVLDAVERTSRPTIVFFLSDNGGLATVADRSPTSSLPLERGKGWPYEGGIRVPTLVRWPGLDQASSVRTPVTTQDFYVTALRAAGVDLPDPDDYPIDGVDVRPLLDGGRIDDRALFFHYPHYSPQGSTPAGAVRHGEFKLIEFFEDDHAELYNVAEDLGEDVELSRAAPERKSQLRDRLADWQERLGAEMPEPNPEYSGEPTPGGYYERQPESTPLADPSGEDDLDT